MHECSHCNSHLCANVLRSILLQEAKSVPDVLIGIIRIQIQSFDYKDTGYNLTLALITFDIMGANQSAELSDAFASLMTSDQAADDPRTWEKIWSSKDSVEYIFGSYADNLETQRVTSAFESDIIIICQS